MDNGVKVEVGKWQWDLQNDNTTSNFMCKYVCVYICMCLFLVEVGVGEIAKDRLPYISKKFKN